MKKILIVVLAMMLAACDETSDSKQNKLQEQLTMQSVDAVGLPAITKFTEKRTLKSILELRDKEVPTYTYTETMDGKKVFLCNSVGYGIPYATQYTNPMKSHQYGPVPQADPNGLFSPASADGTWVLCVNPETKQAAPVLVEPRVIVSPFKL